MRGRPKEENTRNIVCKVRLNEDENNILDEICQQTESTKSDVVRKALAAYHDEMERYFTDRATTSTKTEDILNKAETQGYLNDYEFSILIQKLLISENGYVIDTGNWENVNAEVALRLVEKIKKHPILWKHFFMVA